MNRQSINSPELPSNVGGSLIKIMQLVCLVLLLTLLAILFLFFKQPTEHREKVVTATQLNALSEQDRQEILEEAGIKQVGDHYVATGCADSLQLVLTPVDLNGDAQPEALLQVIGSPCFSGVVQSNVGVFVKFSSGKWRDTLGFLPAHEVRLRNQASRGYADLELIIQGRCTSIYRWSGGSYYQAGVNASTENGEACQR